MKNRRGNDVYGYSHTPVPNAKHVAIKRKISSGLGHNGFRYIPQKNDLDNYDVSRGKTK